jgi:DNA-binding CsgD family transcriptional regulator
MLDPTTTSLAVVLLFVACGCAIAGLGIRRRRQLHRRSGGGKPILRFDPSRVRYLTPREREVARLAARQLPNKQIADALCVSIETVSTHIKRIYSKLGVNSRTALAAYAPYLADEP